MSINGHINSSQDRVLVIGAAGLDIVGRLNNIPDPGVSTPAEVRPSFGGVARNVAENLSRLGQSVSLITAVGTDLFGQQLLDHTAAAGVDVSHCLKTGVCNTASYLAVLTAEGRLQFALDDMRISAALSPEYIRSKALLFKQSGLVFCDCNLNPDTLETVMQMAHEANIPVCADATSQTLSTRIVKHLDRLLMLTANTGEAALLCDTKVETDNLQEVMVVCRDLINRGVEIAVVPMAEFGVCYATSETNGHIPAIHTAILDPTGAGDALTATIIFGLMNAVPLDDAIRLGVSAASLTLRHPGTVMPDLTLEKLYDHLVI